MFGQIFILYSTTSKLKHDITRIELSGYSSVVTKINHLYKMNSLGNGIAVVFELAHFLGLKFAKYGTFAA